MRARKLFFDAQSTMMVVSNVMMRDGYVSNVMMCDGYISNVMMRDH